MDQIDNSHSELPPDDGKLLQGSQSEVFESSLVLASQGIPHYIEYQGELYALVVEADWFERASLCLHVYKGENQALSYIQIKEDISLRVSSLLFMLIPTLSYFWVGISRDGNWIKLRGTANAGAILEGQWWRCITALTLHADVEHFLSNLVSGYLLANLLNHRVPIGSICFSSTVSAALANGMVAYASALPHHSLGFSTAVFSLLGHLAVSFQIPQSERENGWLRSKAPLLAGLFLAVLLGTGENVDVKAHFFGFGMGIVFGLLFRSIQGYLKSFAVQVVLVIISYLIYVSAWMMAIR